MKIICGCCEGLVKLTPLPIANRPGLDALAYRVGTHASFLESMIACLSSSEFPELARLTTRAKNDPSIALLDAWAMVADVLTFYQERIANEGYLRTATERRSILELARLIGYQLRPGVSASVYLGFTMDKGAEADIPIGTRAQSIPGPGESPQAFETSDILPARQEWNGLQPRLTRPQNITVANVNSINDIYFAGTATNLKANDALLFVFGNSPHQQYLRYVDTVETQTDPQGRWERTRVHLQSAPTAAAAMQASTALVKAEEVLNSVEKYLNVDSFGVSKTTAMAKRVLDLAQHIKQSIAADSSDTDILKVLVKSLPDLQEEHAIAIEGHYEKLEPWVGGLVNELSGFENTLKSGLKATLSTTLKQASMLSPSKSAVDAKIGSNDTVLSALISNELIAPLSLTPSIQPANSLRLSRNVQQTFSAKSDMAPRLLASLKPHYQSQLYGAIRSTATAAGAAQVYALRVTAQLFGYNAPKKIKRINHDTSEIELVGEWPVVELPPPVVTIAAANASRTKHETPDIIQMEGTQDKIQPQSWVVVETAQTTLTNSNIIYAKAQNPQYNANLNNFAITSGARGDYGISGKTTPIKLGDPQDPQTSVNWITTNLDTYTPDDDEDFKAIRQTVVRGGAELLNLAEEPFFDVEIPQPPELMAVKGQEIELAQLYDGLEAGRWVIVSGERFDAPGVNSAELLMIASIEQRFDPALPGDKPHTVLILAQAMNYQYKRESVTIYGNVVKATHGETRRQTLGSGDGSKVFQQFKLSYSPLTYVAANNPSGIQSTLQVRVNDVRWEEAPGLFGLGPNDKNYFVRTDNEDKTSVQFGDGIRGLRLPSGTENVGAVYRSGIGKGGNVAAEQISLLATRPLGVKGVINPLPASGGADRDNRDQARRNAPYAVMALDRLVSVQDYADFARTFAGIGKASATRLSDGYREVVHVTIAGAEDIPISETSDLFRSLRAALRDYGDPHQPLQLAVRQLIALILQAKVRINPAYEWEKVEPQIRAALYDYFGFERRELGQYAWLSEAITVIKNVAGVEYVDVDVFDGLAEVEPVELLIYDIEALDERLSVNQPSSRVAAELARLPERQYYTSKDSSQLTLQQGSTTIGFGQRRVSILPAQIAVLKPELKDTLILTELT